MRERKGEKNKERKIWLEETNTQKHKRGNKRTYRERD